MSVCLCFLNFRFFENASGNSFGTGIEILLLNISQVNILQVCFKYVFISEFLRKFFRSEITRELIFFRNSFSIFFEKWPKWSLWIRTEISSKYPSKYFFEISLGILLAILIGLSAFFSETYMDIFRQFHLGTSQAVSLKLFLFSVTVSIFYFINWFGSSIFRYLRLFMFLNSFLISSERNPFENSFGDFNWDSLNFLRSKTF